MSRTRRTFGKDFKAKVVLEALKRKRYLRGISKKIRVASQPNFTVEGGGHKESFCGFFCRKSGRFQR